MTMIILANLFSLGLGGGLLVSRILKGIRVRRKAEQDGILGTCCQYLQSPILMLLVAAPLIFCMYNSYVHFKNCSTYNYIADYAEKYGYQAILEAKGMSADVIADDEKATEIYVSRQRNKAKNSAWQGVGDIGIIMMIVNLELWLFGGYVTLGGWYLMFGSGKGEVIHIREELGKLCFYVADAQKPVMKLPDTIANREQYAMLMETMTEIDETNVIQDKEV